MASQPSFVNLATLLGDKEAALDEEFWQKACELRVAVPATVVSFDTTRQVVTVQPAIKETQLLNSVPTSVSLPQLPNVPIMMMRSGGFSLLLPIVPGDECLVVFADVCIDAWWVSGAAGGPQAEIERRRHDLSDGFALFGPWSQPRKYGSYPTTGAQLRSDDGTTVIEVDEAKVTITPDSGTTQIVVTPGQVNIIGVLKVNGVVVNVP